MTENPLPIMNENGTQALRIHPFSPPGARPHRASRIFTLELAPWDAAVIAACATVFVFLFWNAENLRFKPSAVHTDYAITSSCARFPAGSSTF